MARIHPPSARAAPRRGSEAPGAGTLTQPEPSDPLDAAFKLGEVLEKFGVSYAIGGALAYGVWGIPRSTVDVDVNVFIEEEEASSLWEALESLGIAVDSDQARAESSSRGMFVVRWGLYRIDVFLPSIDFSWEALRTRVERTIEDRRAWFLSAEAVAVFKLLFFRPKDIIDLRGLLAVQGDDIDTSYVRRWMVEMMGEDDERVVRWDELVGQVVA